MSHTPSTAPELTPADARAAITSQADTIKTWLTDLVAYPSVHNFPGLEQACLDAADWVINAFSALPLGATVDKYLTPDGSYAVIGHRPATPGLPTVLLYSHYDVQPATDVDAWESSPWELTERDGRWYGRGTADCKGNVVMHLAALTALAQWEEANPEAGHIGLRIVVEGSEERGTGGLEGLLAEKPELFACDAILIADGGNDTLGEPALTTALRGSADVKVTLRTLDAPIHSGQFGGAAPDALIALVHLLGTLHDDDGLVAVPGLASDATWDGNQQDPAQWRTDAGLVEGAQIIGQGRARINDLTVARPAITITALDAVPTKDVINAVPATAAAWLNLRIPPTMRPEDGQKALMEHLKAHVPWGAQIEMEPQGFGQPFSANVDGPLHTALRGALGDAYGKEVGLTASGGSIPLCAALSEALPGVEIALFGVEEPGCKIHSANESVHPEEIERIATAELLFLTRFGR